MRCDPRRYWRPLAMAAAILGLAACSTGVCDMDAGACTPCVLHSDCDVGQICGPQQYCINPPPPDLSGDDAATDLAVANDLARTYDFSGADAGDLQSATPDGGTADGGAGDAGVGDGAAGDLSGVGDAGQAGD